MAGFGFCRQKPVFAWQMAKTGKNLFMPVFAGLNRQQLASTGKNRINRQLTYNIQANITNVTHKGHQQYKHHF